jgi:hypothetical protein
MWYAGLMEHDDALASLISGQLQALAQDDDQLGRGEYELLSVEGGATECEFFVTVKSLADESAEPRRFKVEVTREEVV